MDPALIGFGLGVGALVGMTGIGGGSLMTPLLILAVGVTPVTAVGTDLTYAAVTKTVGGWKHWRQGTVDAPLSIWMAFGSVPAALTGVYVLERLERAYGHSFDDLMLTLLGAALLLCGAGTLARALLKRFHKRERNVLRLEARHKAAAVVLGAFVGFMLGVTSAGSGALIAIGLILIFRLVPARVVGTDIFHAAMLLWVAAGAHIVAGNVDLLLAANIVIGSVPAVWVGSHVSVRMPVAALRTTLAVVLVASGMALLAKAGTEIPRAAVVPLLIAVLALIIWTTARARRAAAGFRPVRPRPRHPL
jgi:uncharacterized membrane protein YfcA